MWPMPMPHPTSGDRVWVTGKLSMGVMAVLFAFIFPFLILIISLFVFMAIWNDELRSALCSLALSYTLLLYIVAEQVADG